MLQSGHGAATGYLALYNVAFIFPLTIVFLCAFFGLTSASLITFLKKPAAVVKFATAGLCIVLALMLIATA